MYTGNKFITCPSWTSPPSRHSSAPVPPPPKHPFQPPQLQTAAQPPSSHSPSSDPPRQYSHHPSASSVLFPRSPHSAHSPLQSDLAVPSDFQPLLVRRGALGIMHLEFDLVEQLFGNGGEYGLQSVDLGADLRVLALGVHERVAEDEERRR